MSYDITIRDSFDRLGETLERTGCRNRRLCLITDDHVSNFYLSDVYDILLNIGGSVHMMALYAGEQNKTAEALNGIYDALIRHEFGKEDMIVVLGGGTVCDIAGFAAATFRSGIRLFLIPTSLSAQVFSSTAGNAGIDYRYRRNLVGVRYDPCHVYVNTSLIRTQSKEDFAAGMAETIGTGLMCSSNFIDYIANNTEGIALRDEAAGEMIRTCILLNRKLYTENETAKECDRRFGAVFGDAFCEYFGYDRKYGECMALGMAAALHLSRKKGAIDAGEQESMLKLMEDCGLKVRAEITEPGRLVGMIIPGPETETCTMMLLSGIGSVYTDHSITKEELIEAIESINEGA